MATYDLEQTTNYDAFDTDVTKNDIATYRASRHENPTSSWIALIVILIAMSAIFFIAFIISFFGDVFQGYFTPSEIDELMAALIPSIVFAVPTFPIYYFLYKSATNRLIAQIVRFRRFAQANGWQYEQKSKVFKMPGLLFNEGIERHTADVIRSQKGLQFVFGTHNYVTGVGRGRSTNEWGFIVIPVKTNLTHVVLDAVENNGKIFNTEIFSSLPQAFNKDNRITVSADVDETYHVYSAEANGADIAKVITPAFIANMKKLSRSYDIEIVDGNVYVYSSYGFKKNKEQMKEVMQVIDTVAEAFAVPVTKARTAVIDTHDEANVEPLLKGRTPAYVRFLGVFAVIIQFVALIALIISRNN